MPLVHIPVLLSETLELLAPRAGAVYADCTAGHGGHAAAIAARLVPGGTVVLCDLDAGNLARAEAAVRAGAPGVRVVTERGSFASLPRRMGELGLRADLVLADLGFASSQVDDASRGLSFSRDGPLDMRLDPSAPTSAASLVASLSEADLADVIYQFGEERHSRAIARAIVRARGVAPIRTTRELAEIVRGAMPRTAGRSGPGGAQRIDPATRTFQALRIAVNDELGNLDALLDAVALAASVGAARQAGPGRGAAVVGGGLGAQGTPAQAGSLPSPHTWLAPGARVGIITFHSLEDRPVKQCFSRLAESGGAVDLAPTPLRAGEAELAANPRASSAKLRAIRLAVRHDPSVPPTPSTR